MDNLTIVSDLETLRKSVDTLENLLRPLFGKDLVELSTMVSPLDAAKLNATIAYSMATLYVCYLRVQGIDHTTEKIAGQLDNIRDSMTQISKTAKMLQDIEQKAVTKQQQQSSSSPAASSTSTTATNTSEVPLRGNSTRPTTKPSKSVINDVKQAHNSTKQTKAKR